MVNRKDMEIARLSLALRYPNVTEGAAIRRRRTKSGADPYRSDLH